MPTDLPLTDEERAVLRVFRDVGPVLRLPVIAEGASLSTAHARRVLDGLASRAPKLVEDRDPDPNEVDDQGERLPLRDLSAGGERVWACLPAGMEALDALEPGRDD